MDGWERATSVWGHGADCLLTPTRSVQSELTVTIIVTDGRESTRCGPRRQLPAFLPRRSTYKLRGIHSGGKVAYAYQMGPEYRSCTIIVPVLAELRFCLSRSWLCPSEPTPTFLRAIPIVLRCNLDLGASNELLFRLRPETLAIRNI